MMQTVEIYILNLIQKFRCPFLDAVMPKITMLGNCGAVWIVLAAVMYFSGYDEQAGMMVFVGLTVGVITGNLMLKPMVARPRPSWFIAEENLLIKNPSDFSFPSGHTLSSFVSAFILISCGSFFGFAALFLACAIAFSRMYLYVHYPSDILGGILLAGMISAGVLRCF
ncbi:MAG: phosphatase PAP2 family protein [Eubacteriales bacterium]|nr:phosphatase PAP2 family protein [Eubacteriales bacterium]